MNRTRVLGLGEAPADAAHLVHLHDLSPANQPGPIRLSAEMELDDDQGGGLVAAGPDAVLFESHQQVERCDGLGRRDLYLGRDLVDVLDGRGDQPGPAVGEGRFLALVVGIRVVRTEQPADGVAILRLGRLDTRLQESVDLLQVRGHRGIQPQSQRRDAQRQEPLPESPLLRQDTANRQNDQQDKDRRRQQRPRLLKNIPHIRPPSQKVVAIVTPHSERHCSVDAGPMQDRSVGHDRHVRKKNPPGSLWAGRRGENSQIPS